MGVIIKNTIKASLVNYIGVVIGIISVLYLQTMILSPSQIGKIQLIIDKTYLFSPFILFGLVGAVARFSHIFKSKKGYSGFLSWSLITPFVSYLIACILFYVFAEDREYIFEFYIILFFSVYINLFESALTTKAKIVFPLVLRAIVVRLIMILNLVFYFFNLYSFDGFITGFVITHFSHFAILGVYFFNQIRFRFSIDFSFFSHEEFRRIVTYSAYAILGSGAGILITKLDSVMIKSILGDFSLVGVYAIAVHISSLIDMPRRPISQLSVPILSEKLSDNNIEDVKHLFHKSAINLFIIGGIMFCLIWINIDACFKTMKNGVSYESGKYVVFFLGLAKVFDMGFGLNSEIISSSKFYKWNILIMPFLAGISISLNIIFIPKYAIIGSAVATLISVLTYNLVRAIIVYRKLGIHSFSLKTIYVTMILCLPFLVSELIPEIENIYLDVFINSLLVISLAAIPIYLFKFSLEINGIIKKGINLIFRIK